MLNFEKIQKNDRFSSLFLIRRFLHAVTQKTKPGGRRGLPSSSPKLFFFALPSCDIT